MSARDLTKKESAADVKAMTEALAAEFEPSEIKWKPQAVKGNRALAVASVDARVIQDRLDDVLGVEGWQDEYELLPDNSVVCKLRLKLGRSWIMKMDVGSPSDQPDGGDRLKAAFSDALKRAAVKFGIGRYLYRLPLQWCDFDPVKKQFTQTPRLPDHREKKPASAPRIASHSALPADGVELERRLREKDAELASQGACVKGALVAHVLDAGVKAGHGSDITKWTPAAIDLAVEETKKFRASVKPNRAVA